MSTLANIEMLREISHLCLNEEPLRDEQAQWLGRCLTSFLEHRCTSMDEAFQLCFPRGGVPWWREEAMRKRNGALQELADRFLADLSLHAKAIRIRELSVRYAGSSWRHDRARPDMPASFRGTPKEQLWIAFASGAPMPLSQRQLRNILL